MANLIEKRHGFASKQFPVISEADRQRLKEIWSHIPSTSSLADQRMVSDAREERFDTHEAVHKNPPSSRNLVFAEYFKKVHH